MEKNAKNLVFHRTEQCSCHLYIAISPPPILKSSCVFDGAGSFSETSVLSSRGGRACWLRGCKTEIREGGSSPLRLTYSSGIWLNFKFPAAQLHEASLKEKERKRNKGVKKVWLGDFFSPPFLFSHSSSLHLLSFLVFRPSAALCLCVSLLPHPLAPFPSPPAVGAAHCTEVQRCSLWQADREERCSDGGGRPRARTLWSTPVSLDTLLFGCIHTFPAVEDRREGWRGGG